MVVSLPDNGYKCLNAIHTLNVLHMNRRNEPGNWYPSSKEPVSRQSLPGSFYDKV